MDDYGTTQAQEQMPGGGQLLGYNPKQNTRRERLQQQKMELAARTAIVDKALAALDANPELEAFIETMIQAGV